MSSWTWESDWTDGPVTTKEGIGQIEEFLSKSFVNMKLDAIEAPFFYARVVNVLDQGSAIEGILASRHLEKFGNWEIRGRFIKWPDWLEDIHTNDLSDRRCAMQAITPLFSCRGSPQQVCPEEQLVNCSGPADVPNSIARLTEDAELGAMPIN